MHYAAAHGNLEIVKLLWDLGLRPSFKEKNGFTPLHVAAINNQFEVFYELVQLKADYNDKTFIGLNPYQIAQKLNSHSIIEYLDEK
ncbi:ankyrin repeat domain-containing protein [Hyalomma marginatum]|uniref:Alpha-latrotoxin n=1 Tax=Hyalomma marginatum TaxID=34627 RepID=A0A8S4C006_9ACAR|nr:ankyrin repeat domain-containing protein [Hyalomma marginatum]CAG7591227.1 ankyrin repeat domain-containing protein [Hyalomma marginatum]